MEFQDVPEPCHGTGMIRLVPAFVAAASYIGSIASVSGPTVVEPPKLRETAVGSTPE
jgi:hypothetical protein